MRKYLEIKQIGLNLRKDYTGMIDELLVGIDNGTFKFFSDKEFIHKSIIFKKYNLNLKYNLNDKKF